MVQSDAVNDSRSSQPEFSDNDHHDETFLDRYNRLAGLYYRLKGALFYRQMFRHFGRGSQIWRPMLISHPAFISIGDRVLIRDGIRLEAIRTSPSRTPDIRIGNNTNIEQNVHIICHSRIHIGNNVSITGQCAIVDVTHPFADVDDSCKVGARILDEDSYVEIGDGSFLGFGTIVLPNVTIGKGVVTGARSVIDRDIPDYCVVAGTPARVVKRYDQQNREWVRVADSMYTNGNETR